MDGGVSTITHTHRNDNTLLRSCLYTQSHPHTQLQHRTSKLSCSATFVQKPKTTMLNFSHQNDPSCQIPFLSSHTFHHLSPSFLHMHCSSISVQPSYYLIMLKVSQKPGFSPKSWTGGTTWQTRTAACLAVFFQAFVQRMIKKEPGLHLLLSSRGDICEGGLHRSRQKLDRQTTRWKRWIRSRHTGRHRAIMSDIYQEEYLY